MIGLFAKQTLDGNWAGTLAADVVTGIAGAGTTQAAATQLRASVNIVSTATAASADSVRLPVIGGIGETLVVANDDDGTINVFPQVGGTINALSANAAFTMATGKRALFVAISMTKWAAFTS